MAGNFHYNRKKKVPVVFLLRREKNLLQPEKKFQSSVWRVCQFLVLAGNWQFFVAAGKKIVTTRKKKSSSHLSGGCVSFWFWREIGSFFVVAGIKFVTTGKKKFQSSV